MELKLKIGDLETVFTVESDADIARLKSVVDVLRNLDTPEPESCEDNEQEASLKANSTEEEPKTPKVEKNESDVQVEKALRYLKGNPSAQLLKIVSRHPDGCTDIAIKKSEEFGEEVNLGPILSHVTKCCKKAGINREAILDRRTKRMGRGRVLYLYRLTDQAMRIMDTIEDFDKIEKFPFDELTGEDF